MDVCRWLLEQGANASVRDVDGDTPLMVCEEPLCGDLLLGAGAELAATNDAGNCAYFFATWEQRDDMLSWLRGRYAAAGLAPPPVPPCPDDEGYEEGGGNGEDGMPGIAEEAEGCEGGDAEGDNDAPETAREE